MTTIIQPSFYDLPARPYGGKAPAARKDTSRAGAKRIAPKVLSLQQRVLLALHEYGPLSDEAIERVLHVDATRSSRPRRRELELEGFIVDSGDRIKADSGVYVVLWALTKKGEDAARALRETT